MFICSSNGEEFAYDTVALGRTLSLIYTHTLYCDPNEYHYIAHLNEWQLAPMSRGKENWKCILPSYLCCLCSPRSLAWRFETLLKNSHYLPSPWNGMIKVKKNILCT